MSDLTELGRRAVACKGWRWMPGMLVIWPNGNEYRCAQTTQIDPEDVDRVGGNYPCNGWGDDYRDRTAGHPDLSDPATKGCLLALVREAHGCSWMQTHQDQESMRWYVCTHPGMAVDATEAGALVAALEVAP